MTSSILDSIPVVSQLKSAVEWIGGDEAAAKATQEHFIDRAWGVSQIHSAVLLAQGKTDEAIKVQESFVENAVNVVKSAPAVGYPVAAVQYATGDSEGAKESAGLANRTAVAAAPAILFAPLSPPAAIVLGVATAIGVSGEPKPGQGGEDY